MATVAIAYMLLFAFSLASSFGPTATADDSTAVASASAASIAYGSVMQYAAPTIAVSAVHEVSSNTVA